MGPHLRVLMRITAAAALAMAGLPFTTLNVGAESGDSIGDARTIVSVVKADFEKEERSLTVGDSVRQNEIIEVSLDGKGEFRLNDDTKLALGPVACWISRDSSCGSRATAASASR